MFGRTLSFCVAKRDGSRHDKESLAMSGLILCEDRKGSGPLLPSRVLTDRPSFSPPPVLAKQRHPHVRF